MDIPYTKFVIIIMWFNPSKIKYFNVNNTVTDVRGTFYKY